MVAVASFQWNEWTGEIENLKTHIAVMNVDRQARGGRLERKIIIKDGGWPTWGSDSVIFFHRRCERKDKEKSEMSWGVFRHDIVTEKTTRVTPKKYNSMTPAAINENSVAVATIRQNMEPDNITKLRRERFCRHIEIYEYDEKPVRVTKGGADHFNPSVLDGGRRICYHRCITITTEMEAPTGKLDKLKTPPSHEGVDLFRSNHAFPAVSKDGTKLAYVDNEFRTLLLWVAGSKEPRVVYKDGDANMMFSPTWHPTEDTLCVCQGPSFNPMSKLHIIAFANVSTRKESEQDYVYLTDFNTSFNNAFPSFNHDGTKLVFRSTRDRSNGDRAHKNLYILNNTLDGEKSSPAEQLTDGEHVDTHCSWAPRGDLIVFSSTRDKPKVGVPETDNGLDPGYFAVYLVSAADKTWVRVIRSGLDLAGHINHPVFSPDSTSIAFTSDLAAVSADPISLPLFLHSVRPYGDIFTVDIDPDDMHKNQDVEKFHRLTHSRYEYSMPAWTDAALESLKEMMPKEGGAAKCPHKPPVEGAQWAKFTGHLCLKKRCC